LHNAGKFGMSLKNWDPALPLVMLTEVAYKTVGLFTLIHGYNLLTRSIASSPYHTEVLLLYAQSSNLVPTVIYGIPTLNHDMLPAYPSLWRHPNTFAMEVLWLYLRHNRTVIRKDQLPRLTMHSEEAFIRVFEEVLWQLLGFCEYNHCARTLQNFLPTLLRVNDALLNYFTSLYLQPIYREIWMTAFAGRDWQVWLL